MSECALSESANTAALSGADDVAVQRTKNWQSALSDIKSRLTHGALDDPRSTLQMQRRLLDCATDLDRLQAMIARDFDRRQQLESRLRRAQRLAGYDSLTSLPNRRFLLRRLAQTLAYAKLRRQSLAVMYLDIDDFKQINDTHGHAIGDKLLRVVAARLARSVRIDDIVSRLGGDEFACVLAKDIGRDDLGHIATKIFDRVSAPTTLGNIRLTIRPSIGISIFPSDGATAGGLLQCADLAMYHAKRQRTGCAFFDTAARV